MFKKTIATFVAIAFVLMVAPRATTVAQPPAKSGDPPAESGEPPAESGEPPVISLPEDFEPKPIQPTDKALESAIQNQIRKALHEDGVVESGDAMLDDVLNVLKQRGSILDGSALSESIDSSPDTSPKHAKADRQNKRARAAESLLKASRLLQQLGQNDPKQTALIQQMRLESIRLLQPPSKSAE